MPKLNTNYPCLIQLRCSYKFLKLIEKARRSNAAMNGFGSIPNQSEFLRGLIYYWIRKNTIELLIDDLEGNIPEILEHKTLKKRKKSFSREN